RYHWKPDLSWSIIYWSLSFTPIFFGMTLLLEKLHVSRLFILLVSLFAVLVLLFLHRYFEIKDDHLLIASDNPFAVEKIVIATIEKIEV
ncbi:EbsA family protein, partial [Streptococcus suis]